MAGTFKTRIFKTSEIFISRIEIYVEYFLNIFWMYFLKKYIQKVLISIKIFLKKIFLLKRFLCLFFSCVHLDIQNTTYRKYKGNSKIDLNLILGHMVQKILTSNDLCNLYAIWSKQSKWQKGNISWTNCPKIKFRSVLECPLHILQVVYWMEGQLASFKKYGFKGSPPTWWKIK